MTPEELESFSVTIEYFNDRITFEMNKNNPDQEYLDKLIYLLNQFQKYLDEVEVN
jgi:hypothetical protein